MKDKVRPYPYIHTRTLIVFFFLLFVVTVGICIQKILKPQTQKRSVASLRAESVPSSHSLQEMQEIWTNHFQKILDVELLANAYPLPKIQERFNQLHQQIQERYHTNLSIRLITGYLPESKDVLAGSHANAGEPTIEIIVPRLVDLYKSERVKNDVGWESTLSYVVAAGIMHELDHLAFGKMNSTRENPQSLVELVEEERKIWALTCEYTLRPLIEDYQVKLTESEYTYYNKWVEVGRNADNPLWKSFIHTYYKNTRK